MTTFEYLRSIGIGYYYPGTSFLHTRDARIKVLAFSLLILSVALTNSIMGLSFGSLMACIGFWIAGVPIFPSLRTVHSVLPFILLLMIIQQRTKLKHLILNK